MKQHHIICYFILFLAISFWGFSFVFTKSLLSVLSPIAILFFRMAISSTFLVLAYLFFVKKKTHTPSRKDFLYFVLLSLFEPFLYFLFETYSLQITDATVVSVIIATIPIFTVFLSVFYFKENISYFNIGGVFISVIGIIMMLWPQFVDSTYHSKGILLAFGAVLSSVGYSFFLRKLSEQYHPIFIVTFQNLTGTFLFFPLFFLTHSQQEIWVQLHALTTPIILRNILILSILCSTLAFIFYVIAMQKLGLARANIFTNLIPVVTAITAYIIINEHFTIYKIIGILIVISGVICVQYQSPYHKSIRILSKNDYQ